MTESVGFICYITIAASSTGVSGVTVCGTCRSSYNCAVRVTESVGFICYVSVATYGTSVSGVTIFCAGGSSNNCFIIVTESVGFICYITIAASSAGVSGKAVFGTCRSSYNCFVRVTESVNNNGVSGKFFITYRTVNYIVIAAVNGTGGIYLVFYNGFACGVTKSFNFISNISVATSGAGVSGETAFGASRSSYNCAVRVTGCFNNFLCNSFSIASGAMLTCGQTGFGASGSYCFVDNDIVTESCAVGCLTYGTGLSSGAVCIYPSVLVLFNDGESRNIEQTCFTATLYYHIRVYTTNLCLKGNGIVKSDRT